MERVNHNVLWFNFVCAVIFGYGNVIELKGTRRNISYIISHF